MKRTVWIMPHSHYDAEVFIIEKETLEIGYANLVGALNLMRTGTDFKFALDQSCLIEPFLKAYPEEREFFQQMIAEGRLEITGGMYIMPDVNMPSGESFIRQVMMGKQYCQEELNVDVRTGWTIDTFGHHPQIPQLMLKCGFDHNTFQRLMAKDGPSEFYYQGLDGSRLFCHWMPGSYAAFYGAPGNLHEFKKFVADRIQRLAPHAVSPHLLAASGADLTPADTNLLAMIPLFNQSQDEIELRIATPQECFTLVRASGDFPTITADLNPVFQGCYSARIDIKQWNRVVENLLVDCEKMDAIAQRLQSGSRAEEVWEAWRGVLFNQFHDIICGSHVDAVFENTMDRFKQSKVSAERSLHSSLKAIAGQIDTRGAGVALVVFNTLSWERTDAVECPVAFSSPDTFELAVQDAGGRLQPCDLLEVERYANGSIKRARVLFIARNVPSCGYEVYHLVPANGESESSDLSSSHPLPGVLRFELDKGWLENSFVRVELDLWSGLITSLYDKTNVWEVLAEGTRQGNAAAQGNMVFKEQDFGNFWTYNGPCKGDEFYPIEGRYPLPDINSPKADFAHTYLGDGSIRQGKAMAEFAFSHPYGTGFYSTRVRIYAGMPRVDIQTTLINQDERVRYRVAFPTTLQAGTITHEIPFGAIARPEGELPAQNWMDYSDRQHGVTLLNHGLPGNNVVDGVMMLSLLKCTALKEGYGEVGGFKLSTPTDQGYEKGKKHVFDYALVPHQGDWRDGEACQRGAEFNSALLVFKPAKQDGSLPARQSFISLEGDSAILSAVKAGRDGSMVIRIYESEGRALEQAAIRLAWPIQQAFETNLLEQDQKDLQVEAGCQRIALDLKPFEIKTVRVVFG